MIRTLFVLCVILAAETACDGGSGTGSRSVTAPPASVTSVAPTPAAQAACSPARPHAAGDSNETIDSGGLTRTYILHIPSGYDGSMLTPLVLSFHPSETNASIMAGLTKSSAVADTSGTIVVTPNGQGQPQDWNAAGGADDVAFVKGVMATLDAGLCIDTSRTYADGYSAGADMALRLACALPQRIAAVGVVGATYADCIAAVPLIGFHGIADPLVPFEGGTLPAEAGGGTVPPIRRAASDWAVGLGCDGLPTISSVATDVELSTFTRCRGGGGDVLLYAITGGGHTWPGAADLDASLGATNRAIDATQLMWKFFLAHRRS